MLTLELRRPKKTLTAEDIAIIDSKIEERVRGLSEQTVLSGSYSTTTVPACATIVATGILTSPCTCVGP